MSFGGDWVSYGRHRILVHGRDGFPDDYIHEIARLSARVLDGDYVLSRSQVVSVFHDEKNGVVTVWVGTDMPELEGILDERLGKLYELLWPGRAILSDVSVVAVGNRGSDHYDQAAYFSEQLFEEGRLEWLKLK